MKRDTVIKQRTRDIIPKQIKKRRETIEMPPRIADRRTRQIRISVLRNPAEKVHSRCMEDTGQCSSNKNSNKNTRTPEHGTQNMKICINYLTRDSHFEKYNCTIYDIIILTTQQITTGFIQDQSPNKYISRTNKKHFAEG